MKSTDIARRDRELKRLQKKQDQLNKKVNDRDNLSVGTFIKRLNSLFFFDETKIYNIDSSEVMDLLEEIKLNMPEKEWENIFRKAVRKTKVEQKEEAISKLKEIIEL